jgi:hypothetical protein
MTEILALLQAIAPHLPKTTLGQMSHVIFGMLVISGRITMLGLSCLDGERRQLYRTIQRFYYTKLPWIAIHRATLSREVFETERHLYRCGR